MARQKSIIKLEGTIGDITFFKSKDGYIAREKTSISKDRILNDPAFQRTRENGAEFGRAGKAGKVLRTAFRPLLQNTADSKMVSRLTKAMMRVVQADEENDRGLRIVAETNTPMLQGFDFNEGGKLGSTFFAPITPVVNRVAGTVTIAMPSLDALNMITSPSGATHFQLICSAAEINFDAETSLVSSHASGVSPLSENSLAVNLEAAITANTTMPIFIVFGIEFYQEVNSVMYALKSGSFNCLQIVSVDIV